MKQIPLTQGKVALVDDADFDYLSQWKWHLRNSRGKLYAGRMGPRPERKIVWMHKELCDGEQVDHKDGDGLNNQRQNLRPSDYTTNQQNSKPRGLKGVSRHHKKWRARITYGGKTRIIGRFDTEVEAAKAYDEMAIAVFGEFANTNF